MTTSPIATLLDDQLATAEQAQHSADRSEYERICAAYAMCKIAPTLTNVDAVALYDAGYRKEVTQ